MRRSVVFFLLALGLILGACRSTTAQSTVPAAEDTSPATSTTLPEPAPATTTSIAAEPAFPVTVETDQGPVTLPQRPDRIVSLSATHTEMLYAVGAGPQVVATDLFSNYPPQAELTPKLDAFSFSIEEVAAQDPDLVILAFDFQGEADALAALEIPFLLLGPPATLEGALQQHLVVGAATGHGEAAEALVEEVSAGVAEIIEAATPYAGTTIFHEVDETLFSATSGSFIGDLYGRLGFVNIADAAGVDGPFPQLTAEFVVDQDPEFIFLADAGFGVTPESVAERPGWDTISAVAEDNVVALDGDIAGRWGPRTVDLLGSIYRAVLVGSQ
ncbi:MAG: ABC transporter substrate-binding protein [Acidimicrobiia bacterium]|nr:ABC transporter substrate-binding protein [Acidimicrobiia bacterium]NNF11478.1 ABC transporter substrate-binding protein [Acidimicrobiia bacterium]